MGTAYYRSLLNAQEQTAYDTIVHSFRRFKSKVKIPAMSADSADRAYTAVRLDNPELFFLDNHFTFRMSMLYTVIEVNFLYSLPEAAKLLDRMKRIAGEVVSKIRGMQDHQIAAYLHDYLVERITYSGSNNQRNEAHSIVGALIHHSCVCEGYAKAYKFLCDRAGVPCMVVTGTAAGSDGHYEGHAWNIVKIGSDCCHVDVTFDEYVERTYCSRAHLFLSTDEILVAHRISPVFPVPNSPRSHLPLVRVKSVEGLMEALRQDQHKKLGYSEYVLPSYVEPQKFTAEVAQKFSLPDLLLVGKIRGYFYSDCQKVNVIGVKWR